MLHVDKKPELNIKNFVIKAEAQRFFLNMKSKVDFFDFLQGLKPVRMVQKQGKKYSKFYSVPSNFIKLKNYSLSSKLPKFFFVTSDDMVKLDHYNSAIKKILNKNKGGSSGTQENLDYVDFNDLDKSDNYNFDSTAFESNYLIKIKQLLFSSKT